MRKSLLTKIEKFLANRIKVAQGEERAEADQKDVDVLASIINDLVNAKWEPSYDAWTPVDTILVNRSTHDPFYFEPMPSDWDEDTKVTFEDKMRVANANCGMAAEHLNRVWRLQESKLRRDKAIKAGLYCSQHGEIQLTEINEKTKHTCRECTSVIEKLKQKKKSKK